jgi:hypothetical protein
MSLFMESYKSLNLMNRDEGKQIILQSILLPDKCSELYLMKTTRIEIIITSVDRTGVEVSVTLRKGSYGCIEIFFHRKLSVYTSIFFKIGKIRQFDDQIFCKTLKYDLFLQSLISEFPLPLSNYLQKELMEKGCKKWNVLHKLVNSVMSYESRFITVNAWLEKPNAIIKIGIFYTN